MTNAPKKISKQSIPSLDEARHIVQGFSQSPGMQRLRKYFEEGDPSRTKVLHVSPEGP